MMINSRDVVRNFGIDFKPNAFITFVVKPTEKKFTYNVTVTLSVLTASYVLGMENVFAKKAEDIFRKNKYYKTKIEPKFLKFYLSVIDLELAKKEKDQEERLIADYKEALKLFDPNYQHLEGEEFKRNSSLKKKIESLKRYLGDKVE